MGSGVRLLASLGEVEGGSGLSHCPVLGEHG